MDSIRHRDLKAMLEARLKDAQQSVSARVKDIRVTNGRGYRDATDAGADGIQGEIDVALLQLTSDLVSRITGALTRLESGNYGYCWDCGGEIPAVRLRALPFAARCTPCQDSADIAESRERRLERRALGTLLSRLTDHADKHGW